MTPLRLLPTFLRRRDPATGEPLDDTATSNPLGTNYAGSPVTPPFVAAGTMTAGGPTGSAAPQTFSPALSPKFAAPARDTFADVVSSYGAMPARPTRLQPRITGSEAADLTRNRQMAGLVEPATAGTYLKLGPAAAGSAPVAVPGNVRSMMGPNYDPPASVQAALTQPLGAGMGAAAADVNPAFSPITPEMTPPPPGSPALSPAPGVIATPARDYRREAELDLGPERRLGGWGRALQIALGALGGMTGQQVPEELTPMGRHRIYEAELDRREGRLRQADADQQAAEDRPLRDAYRQAQIDELKHRHDPKPVAPLEPKIAVSEGAATIYDPNTNTLRYMRDPNAPTRAAGNPDTLWQRDESGYETQYERGADGHYTKSLDAQGNPIRRAPTPEKPEKPSAADINSQTDALYQQYAGSDKGLAELQTLKNQVLWNSLRGIDRNLVPEKYDAEVERLNGIVAAASEPVMVAAIDPATKKPKVDEAGQPVMVEDEEGSKRAQAAAVRAQARLDRLQKAYDAANKEAETKFEARARERIGAQVRAGQGATGAPAAARPVTTAEEALAIIDANEKSGNLTHEEAEKRRAAVRARAGGQ